MMSDGALSSEELDLISKIQLELNPKKIEKDKAEQEAKKEVSDNSDDGIIETLGGAFTKLKKCGYLNQEPSAQVLQNIEIFLKKNNRPKETIPNIETTSFLSNLKDGRDFMNFINLIVALKPITKFHSDQKIDVDFTHWKFVGKSIEEWKSLSEILSCMFNTKKDATYYADLCNFLYSKIPDTDDAVGLDDDYTIKLVGFFAKLIELDENALRCIGKWLHIMFQIKKKRDLWGTQSSFISAATSNFTDDHKKEIVKTIWNQGLVPDLKNDVPATITPSWNSKTVFNYSKSLYEKMIKYKNVNETSTTSNLDRAVQTIWTEKTYRWRSWCVDKSGQSAAVPDILLVQLKSALSADGGNPHLATIRQICQSLKDQTQQKGRGKGSGPVVHLQDWLDSPAIASAHPVPTQAPMMGGGPPPPPPMMGGGPPPPPPMMGGGPPPPPPMMGGGPPPPPAAPVQERITMDIEKTRTTLQNWLKSNKETRGTEILTTLALINKYVWSVLLVGIDRKGFDRESKNLGSQIEYLCAIFTVLQQWSAAITTLPNRSTSNKRREREKPAGGLGDLANEIAGRGKKSLSRTIDNVEKETVGQKYNRLRKAFQALSNSPPLNKYLMKLFQVDEEDIENYKMSAQWKSLLFDKLNDEASLSQSANQLGVQEFTLSRIYNSSVIEKDDDDYERFALCRQCARSRRRGPAGWREIK